MLKKGWTFELQFYDHFGDIADVTHMPGDENEPIVFTW